MQKPMKAKLLSRVVSVVLLAGLRLSSAAPVVLLTDNFAGTATPDSNDLNYNLPGRQTGPLGMVSYTTDGNTQVGNVGSGRSLSTSRIASSSTPSANTSCATSALQREQ